MALGAGDCLVHAHRAVALETQAPQTREVMARPQQWCDQFRDVITCARQRSDHLRAVISARN
eukprot:8110274-Lingulodinium_polyedra.AAC.1